MEEIADSKEGAAGKRIMPSFPVPLIVLLVVLVPVVFFDSATEWVVGGMLIAIGFVILRQRADTQMRAAKAQADAVKSQADIAKAQEDVAKAQMENNKLIEKGHTQERFKTAMEHLGHDNASVRIFSFYEFAYLIKDNGEEYRKCVLDILYAHIRITTTDFANHENVKEAEKDGSIKPTEETQELVNILFKFQGIDRSDIEPNLQKVYFAGADLANGNLSGADLSKASLFGAWLSGAKLSGADLSWADLSWANLSGADLSGSDLSWAKLPGVDLSEANLYGADLSWAKLSGANLSKANLSKVDLSDAKLSRANMSGAKLSDANLWEANLSDAKLSGADLSGASLLAANLSGVDLSDANLCKANLDGADLSRSDLSGAKLSGAYSFSTKFFKVCAPWSKIQLGRAFYTNTTQFPEWIVPPITPPDNGDKVQFPEGFFALEKPEDDK